MDKEKDKTQYERDRDAVIDKMFETICNKEIRKYKDIG